MQAEICKAIEDLDGEAKFISDAWVRENGGGGISRVMSGGKVFEKAGINLSVVYGTMPKEALTAATERGVNRARGMKDGKSLMLLRGLSSRTHRFRRKSAIFRLRYFLSDSPQEPLLSYHAFQLPLLRD